MSISRRSFVQGTMTAATAIALGGTKVLGANEELRVAVVGVRGRGGTHIDYVNDVPGCRVTVLCDVDQQELDKRVAWTEKNYKWKTEKETNWRRLLERKDIDIISIATPNHLHSIIGIEAMAAGKDVYCEKPVSHNVWEGRQLVNASRKYNRICQTGTQSRSMHGMRQMIDFIHEGNLGKIKYVVGTCYKPRPSIGKRDTPLEIPSYIDYDLWCGPAAKVDLFRNQLHYDWHWDFNTGAGDLGNQGIHQMDLGRWFLNQPKLSPRVMSMGGRLGYDDAGNTPNTQIVYHDYPGAPLIFEVRGLPDSADKLKAGKWSDKDMPRLNNTTIGVLVHCEGGLLVVGSYSSGVAYDNDGKKVKAFSGGGNHYANFVEAIRSRQRDGQNAEIEDGHISSALCHTGNISYKLGKLTAGDAIKEAIKSDAMATESYGRMVEQLGKLDISVDKPTLTMGPWLNMDPATERFTNNDDANKLLKREYRKGFVVEEIKA
ncbi:MAG: gfo/Idh/MocA family oxidoreductase [Planctomycetes bacterium]|nr:gfo/Idh/MocA family oxidoreductase [Planctomycetota bacterium]